MEEVTGYVRGAAGGLSGGSEALRNQRMRKLGKWNLACGFRKTAFETYAGQPIPSQRVQPLGGCTAQARPSSPPRRRRHGQSWPTSTKSSALWGRRAAWGARSHPMGPSPAASAAPEKPTHSSSAIFSPILRSLRDHRAAGLAGPAFASGFRWRRGTGGGVSAAQGRHFCPFVSMARGWEVFRERSEHLSGLSLLTLRTYEIPVFPFHRVGTFWGKLLWGHCDSPWKQALSSQCPGIRHAEIGKEASSVSCAEGPQMYTSPGSVFPSCEEA